jgi:hypothetical protein
MHFKRLRTSNEPSANLQVCRPAADTAAAAAKSSPPPAKPTKPSKKTMNISIFSNFERGVPRRQNGRIVGPGYLCCRGNPDSAPPWTPCGSAEPNCGGFGGKTVSTSNHCQGLQRGKRATPGPDLSQRSVLMSVEVLLLDDAASLLKGARCERLQQCPRAQPAGPTRTRRLRVAATRRSLRGVLLGGRGRP